MVKAKSSKQIRACWWRGEDIRASALPNRLVSLPRLTADRMSILVDKPRCPGLASSGSDVFAPESASASSKQASKQGLVRAHGSIVPQIFGRRQCGSIAEEPPYNAACSPSPSMDCDTGRLSAACSVAPGLNPITKDGSFIEISTFFTKTRLLRVESVVAALKIHIDILSFSAHLHFPRPSSLPQQRQTRRLTASSSL